MNYWAAFVPMAMLSVGTGLQAKDSNKTGADDAIGTVCIALAPAVTATLDGTNNEKVSIRAMKAIRDASQAYLDSVGQG